MNNKYTIVPRENNLIKKINTSLDIAKKLISQGGVLEKNYSKVYVIPFKKSDGWYLFDKRINCLYKGPYRFVSRDREFILCLDFNKIYWLFKNDKILCHFLDFTHDKSLFEPKCAAPFKIIENKYIVLYYYEAEYGRKYIESYRLKIQGIFDFDGNKIENPLTEKDLEVILINENKEDLKIADTLWKINGATLNFKNHIILNIEDILEISVSDFHYGYAKVKEVLDYDPEFGEMTSDIGYIDVYGNIYWEPGLKYGWDRADEPMYEKNEPSDENDLPF